jgi:uncharacterized alpha-E superfamily protein
VATWWCGQPECHKYVVEHLDELIIRRAFRRRGDEQEFNRRLSELSADQLRDLIATAPHQYVGQERVTRSTAPVWTAVRQLSPAYIALRAYVAADGDSYTVMQGALARTSAEPQPLEISILSGEGSKDVWVVSSQPVKQVSLLPTQGTGIRLRRGGAELPSRVAEDLFWVGRYLERGDAHARLLRTLVARLTDETSVESVVELPALLRALAKQGQIEPGFAVEGMRDAMPAIDQTLPAAVLDETQSGGLRSTISAFFRTASQVRDRLSLDSWRIVRRIDRRLRLPRGSGDIEMSDLPAVLDRLIVGLAAFSGLVMESMTRSLGWRFLDMGRRLERAQQVTGMVMSMLERHRSCPPQVLEALLASADSLMTYRSRYLSDMQVAAVLDLLVTDETNPRSLAFQLAALVEHVGLLPRDHSLPQLAEEQRLAMSLLHEIRMTDVTVLAEAYNLGQWEPLRQVLEEADQRLPRLSDALYHRYLIHSGPAWQLSDIRPGIES